MKIRLSLANFLLAYIIFSFFVYNYQFFHDIYLATTSVPSFLVIFTTFFIIVVTLNYLLYLILFSFSIKVLKPALIIILLINSVACYFINTYNVYLDKAMIENVFQTDAKEAADLFSFVAVFYFIFLGILPSILVYKAKITKQKSFKIALLKQIVVVVLILLSFFGWYFANSKQIMTFWRANKDITSKNVPNGYYSGIFSYVKKIKRLKWPKYPHKEVELNLKYNSKINANTKQKVMIMIVGETARRHNFSLYGYDQNTNPMLLKQKELFVFKNMISCGTSTAESVPCIFYPLGSEQYHKERFEMPSYINYLNKLDDFKIVWYDNNFGGCYKNCQKVEHYSMQNMKNEKHCENGNCLDGAFLDYFEKHIKQNKAKNLLIVFHQNGSHGPLYYKRYPKQFEKFTPTCSTNNPQDCSTQQLINTYNNTILYNDYILSEIINKLKQHTNYESFMLYTSDHGESLGENGFYLHGMPYSIAPKYQKEVPLLAWLSSSVYSKYNSKCIANKATNNNFTHDAIINSALGFFDIKSDQYKKDYDIFYGCKK